MSDRGVSEVIAFVLIFSVVITSVGLLYTAGFGSINQIQEDETDRSAQQAFSASAVALQDIQRGQGEHRAFDVELSGRTMAIDDDLSLSVSIDGTDVSNGDADGGLVYGLGADTKIVYQSGAVIRSDGPDSQTVIRTPEFTCTDGHAVVSLVTLTGPSGSVSSDGSIEIRADGPLAGDETVVASATGGPHTLTVSYGGTPYEAAWERYFEDYGWSTSSGDATCTADSVYVRNVPIDLEYAGV
ncbi:hypothetical protein GCM10028857_04920 [Salinarchaeum chitinilyticum]